MDHRFPLTVRPAWSAWHFRWAAGGMFALTIYGSLLPFNFTSQSFDTALACFRQIVWYPTSELGARGDWIISAVQFTILTFLATGAMAVDRRPRVGKFAALLLVPLCLALAVTIEFLQIYFPPRTVSLNDIIVEAVGGVTGVTAWLLAGQRITRWLRRFGNHASVATLAKWQLPGYLVAVFIVQLMPFDFVIVPAELAVKLQEGKVHFVPLAGPWDADGMTKSILNILCFLPLGFLRNFALGCQRRHWSGIFWLAISVPAAIEFLQFFVYSRSCDVTDVFTGAAGVWLGAKLAEKLATQLANSTTNATHLVPNSMARFMVFLHICLLWLIVLFYFSWRPFDFTTEPQHLTGDEDAVSLQALGQLRFLPFVDYYWGSKYNALDQFIRKSLAFFPLGALLALGSRGLFRPRRTWLVVFLAMVVGIIVEIGRCYLPNRGPSTTDLLIGCAGAVIGFKLTQHFQAVFWAESAFFGWQQLSPKTQSAAANHHDAVRAVIITIPRH